MGRPGTPTGRLILAATLILLACQDPDPADELTEVFSSAHYTFHLAAGDDVDTTWQERYFDWVVEALDVTPAGRLDYFKYRDRAHLKRLTGRETNGFAEPGTTRLHTIWPVDHHEVVHPSRPISRPPRSQTARPRPRPAFERHSDAVWPRSGKNGAPGFPHLEKGEITSARLGSGFPRWRSLSSAGFGSPPPSWRGRALAPRYAGPHIGAIATVELV